MRLSGIVPFSLLDYPGKVSCIVFTLGCNFRCGYCHNKEFVLPHFIEKNIKNIIPEKIFFQFLQKRVGLLDGVSICGGEPTIHKDLEDFCSKIKSFGFLVKLDTNGTNPKILKRLLKKGLVDYIAMDIKADLENYDFISGGNISKKNIQKSINLLKESKIEYEFRTTFIDPFHTARMVENIGKLTEGAKKYFLQNFSPGDPLDINFSGRTVLHKDILEFKKIMEKYVVSAEIRL